MEKAKAINPGCLSELEISPQKRNYFLTRLPNNKELVQLLEKLRREELQKILLSPEWSQIFFHKLADVPRNYAKCEDQKTPERFFKCVGIDSSSWNYMAPLEAGLARMPKTFKSENSDWKIIQEKYNDIIKNMNREEQIAFLNHNDDLQWNQTKSFEKALKCLQHSNAYDQIQSYCTNNGKLLEEWKKAGLDAKSLPWAPLYHKNGHEDGNCADIISQWLKEKSQGNNGLDSIFERTGNWSHYNLPQRLQSSAQFEKYARQLWAQREKNQMDHAVVASPEAISIWTRNDKIIVNIGESHDAGGVEECLKEGKTEPFLSWFVRNVVEPKGSVPWDVFVESRAGIIYEIQNNPSNLIRNWSNSYHCFPPRKDTCPRSVRMHHVDIRPPSQYRVRFLGYYKMDTESPLLQHKLFWEETFDDLRENLQDFSLAFSKIQKQISKIENKHDRLVLETKLANLKRKQATLSSERSTLVEKIKKASAPFPFDEALVEFTNQVLEWGVEWQDVYAVSRLMKPYVKRAMLLTGDQHRRNMDRLFAELGFYLEYKEINNKNCISTPTIAQW
jgi:hypothetical protein